MLEKMKEIIAEQLSIDADTVTETSRFMALEEEYEVEIPSEELEKLLTVGDVMEYLKAKGVED